MKTELLLVSNRAEESNHFEAEFEEKEGTSSNVKAEEFPELPNVDGLVQSREMLVQVLLPGDEFLNFFKARGINNNAISRATAGCLMAFRIASKEEEAENKEVIVDQIRSVRNCAHQQLYDVHFMLGHVVNASNLVPVDESQITDRVFDQWLLRLAIKNEPVPDVQVKYARKMHAISRLAEEVEWAKPLESLGGKLPDIARIIVTRKEVQQLVNRLKPDDLNRVLTGCFVAVNVKKFELKLEKQQNMHCPFVVPIARVVQKNTFLLGMEMATAVTVLRFSSQIRVIHQKTGQQLKEVGLQNVGDLKLNGTNNKFVLQCLLMMAELNIPWPSEEKSTRKWAQLQVALAKANCRSR